MGFKFKTFTAIAIIAASCLSAPSFAYTYGEPCGVSLDRLSKASGAPGEIFEMYGNWGEAQEFKLPSINMGGQNSLEVISWTSSVLTVRIPQNLGAGKYKVGVYCNDPGAGSKGTYSSGWTDFDVITAAAAGQTPQADNRPLIETAGIESAAAPAAAVQPLAPPPPRQPQVKDTSKTSAVEKLIDEIVSEIGNIDLDIGNFMLQIIVAIVVIVIVLGVILWLKQTAAFDAKADFKFSKQPSSPPGQGQNSMQPQVKIPPPFAGSFKGVEYAVESLDSETMTVHIEIPELLPKRFDFFTKEMPRFGDMAMETEVNALVRLGAVYIDVSRNTTWVAALFPFDVRIDKGAAEVVVAHLMKLRDLCSR